MQERLLLRAGAAVLSIGLVLLVCATELSGEGNEWVALEDNGIGEDDLLVGPLALAGSCRLLLGLMQ